jgi:hypothetical protein
VDPYPNRGPCRQRGHTPRLRGSKGGMQPWETVDRARVADGTELSLARRGDEWVVRAGGRVLMSSRQHGSEDALAELALARLARPGGARTVLIGGLGLGYTLRATLDRIGPDARAVVAEISPELVAWNRGPLVHLAGCPLDDPRTRLQVGDVVARDGAGRQRPALRNEGGAGLRPGAVLGRRAGGLVRRSGRGLSREARGCRARRQGGDGPGARPGRPGGASRHFPGSEGCG